ncbi:MAG: hypothetical protein CM15mV3_1660 [Caudoviricetes sp.]|nr:MAG: hypothetical protein CM15mV3_1660 [Caudoviricetes sp.]
MSGNVRLHLVSVGFNIAADTDTGITYADFTTATLAYSGLGGATLDGYKYRVKITSAGGTEEVISNGQRL